MMVQIPVPNEYDDQVLIRRRSNGSEADNQSLVFVGDMLYLREFSWTLPDGDYYLELQTPFSALFCCRVENQVATIADFWPQLDMLRAMQTGKAYNWTNQANEVLRVAIEEAP